MTKVELSELRENWHDRVTAFQASGQSGAAWCAAHGIKTHQLWYWVRRFQNISSSQTSPKFLSLNVQNTDSTAKAPLLVRVGAVTIEVHPGYDEQLLRNLVQTLMPQC